MEPNEVQTQAVIETIDLTVEQIEKLDPVITEIKFFNCVDKSAVWAEVIHALSQRKNLRTVSFEKCGFLFNLIAPRSAVGEKALYKLNQLTSLTLEDCCLSQEVVQPLSKLVGLEELNISGNNMIECIEFLRQLVNLKKLSLSFRWIDESKMKQLLHLTKLQSLTIEDAPCSLSSFEIIKKIQNLTQLNITCRECMIQNVEKIYEMVKLQRLSICYSALKKKNIPFYNLKNLKNLVSLHIPCLSISKGPVNVFSTLPHLIELQLQECEIDDEGCRQLSKIINLVKLKIQNKVSQGFGRIGISFISQLKNLQQLTLITRLVGPYSIKPLTELKNLRDLCLNNNWHNLFEKIDDSYAKVISELQNLQRLSIYYSVIGAEGIRTLSRGLINLKYLKLQYNSVGNEGIFELRKLTKLKIVELGHCQFDANGILFIERMNHLNKLKLDLKFIGIYFQKIQLRERFKGAFFKNLLCLYE